MSVEPRLIAQYRCDTGEGPLWHPQERALYWMDIPPGRLFRYDPATGKHAQVRQGGTLGAATIQTDGSLLLMGGPGCTASHWRWNNGQPTETPARQIIPGESRFNDAFVDSAGRIYSGTMAQPGAKGDPAKLGALYRLDPDGLHHRLDRGFACPNGMALTPDGRIMLFVSTTDGVVYAYDYDPADGAMTHRRVHLKLDEPAGSAPDGMLLDADGCLWSARWGGGCLMRYDPAGQFMQRLDIPEAKNITSLTFGGDDLDVMYITTAGGQDPAKNGANAGSLFEVILPGVRGVAEWRSRFDLDAG